MVKPDNVIKNYIFFSYSHENEKQARKIIQALQDADYDVWFDDHLAGGQRYHEIIAQRIKDSDCMICLVTDDFYASKYCLQELNVAFENNKFIVPIYMGDYKLMKKKQPSSMDIPLAGRQDLKAGTVVQAEAIVKEIQKIDELDICNRKLNEEKRISRIYREAVQKMQTAQTEEDYEEAAMLFSTIRQHPEASKLEKECLGLAETSRMDAILAKAEALMKKNTIEGYEEAISHYKELGSYKDAAKKLEECQGNIAYLKAERYEQAMQAMQSATTRQDYVNASEQFKAILGYKEAGYLSDCCWKMAKNIEKADHENQGKLAALKKQVDHSKIERAILGGLSCILVVALIICCVFYKGKIDEYNAYLEKEETMIEENNTRIDKLEYALSMSGPIVTFGTYEQDGNEKNGKEPIQWKVLAVEGDRMLVISLYGLDVVPYNTELIDVTWETCTMRKWLNEVFYEEAFSEEEKRRILETRVKAEANPSYGTNAGNDTMDKVFLLNIQEAKKYFTTDEERRCMPTKYAMQHGAWTSEEGYCWWWLRSPGISPNNAALVDSVGSLFRYGDFVNFDGVAVRQSLWINLES